MANKGVASQQKLKESSFCKRVDKINDAFGLVCKAHWRQERKKKLVELLHNFKTFFGLKRKDHNSDITICFDYNCKGKKIANDGYLKMKQIFVKAISCSKIV